MKTHSHIPTKSWMTLPDSKASSAPVKARRRSDSMTSQYQKRGLYLGNKAAGKDAVHKQEKVYFVNLHFHQEVQLLVPLVLFPYTDRLLFCDLLLRIGPVPRVQALATVIEYDRVG